MSPSVLMVIAPQDFRDEELLVPRALLTAQGWAVTTASTQAGTATGMLGATEIVTTTLDDVSPTDFDALVVVGGMGSLTYLWEHATLRSHIQQADSAGKVLGAICLSGAVLGLAGVLQGKRATVWEIPESRTAIEANGGTLTGEPVTVDGCVVTANGPDAADAFGQALIATITENIAAAV